METVFTCFVCFGEGQDEYDFLACGQCPARVCVECFAHLPGPTLRCQCGEHRYGQDFSDRAARREAIGLDHEEAIVARASHPQGRDWPRCHVRRLVWGFADYQRLRYVLETRVPSDAICALWAVYIETTDSVIRKRHPEGVTLDLLFLAPPLPGTSYQTDPRYEQTCYAIGRMTRRIARLDPMVWPDDLARSMQIFVVNVVGRSITLEVATDWRVEWVMGLIEQMERIPVAQQRLMHAGRQLEEARLLSDYGIQKESQLYLLLRLSGD
jgi:hypothetical protein